jgi:tRNA dimethylallyltransferase
MTAVPLLSGPTGIGKTELAVRLAERFAIEIVSADSMQVYRGMEIGTAQPTAEDRRRARFHLCGAIEPTEGFSVARFLELCDAAHRQIVARGRVPIYVGGTGMYLRALRWGLFEGAGRNEAIRTELEGQIAREGSAAVHRRLAAIDPQAARRIDPADAMRIVRALEVHAVSGRRISELQAQWCEPQARFAHALIVLDAPLEGLRRRLAARVDAMLAAGWVEETRRLLEAGVTPERHCFKALGYREILAHLRGEIDEATMRTLIATRTGQFARRQRTWLRGERDAQWIRLAGESPLEALPELEILLEKLGIGSV